MRQTDGRAGSVLVLNAGSSSLKYQLVDPGTGEVRAKGLVERIGESGPIADHRQAVEQMAVDLKGQGADLAASGVVAVGHRVVHGGPDFSEPVVIDDSVIADIEGLIPLAPLHNPGALAGIRAARAQLDVPHVAVFDTAFFARLPAAAATYAIPAELAREHRIRRYGFHGTSHAYVSRKTAETLGRPLAALRQVVLHLGNGCSASAIRGGVAVDTSMGLTPLQGLVMGTRSGDVDPSLHGFLHTVAGLSIEEIDQLLNKQSGLKGLAGVNDFRELLQLRADGDTSAALAFDVYVHRLKHYLGAYLALLGGLDALTFTAGVGENNPAVREATVAGMAELGIEIDPELNQAPAKGARLISPAGSRTQVLVVPTNEELAIAQQTLDALG
ncbi:MAG TPA: acetate kinase [Propionibacteriaceae bacterium]|nr:acetate kinase [Propionibacteriaceae bacterium]